MINKGRTRKIVLEPHAETTIDMFRYLHVGVRRDLSLLVVDEKQEEEEDEEEETIFQENLKSTNGHNQSHGFGLHRNLTN